MFVVEAVEGGGAKVFSHPVYNFLRGDVSER